MKSLLNMRVLALVALISCTAAIAADAPGKPKTGWDGTRMKQFADACTERLLQSATLDYNAAARAQGVTLHKPFPKEAFRDSAFPMCLCISERVAQTWTFEEMDKSGMERSRPMIDEALGGGRCKPAGMLGEIRNRQKAGQ